MKKIYVLPMCLIAAFFSLRAGAQPAPALTVDTGHPWRPPFGVARVGQATHIVIARPETLKKGEQAVLAGYRGDRELLREAVDLAGETPVARAIDPSIDRVVLLGGDGDAWRELATLPIEGREFEADAEAEVETRINPVDLGAIFPPADWLVLTPGQRSRLRVAAFSRTQEAPGAHAVAWFDGTPSQRAEAVLPLGQGKRSEVEMALPEPAFKTTQDVLHVSIQGADGADLWHKQIHVILVKEPPTWPRFGAREMRLRYDLPISLLDRDTGTLSTMPYEEGWPESLQDVVVSLPNGSRFVFWRGSSYVPFWAGRSNTGLCHEWAETGPLPEGFVDSVEPLMDKELRYSRVRIVESTPARVHVRWTYQSCDFNYKVWGDAAQEDFYFYPDGFGTRVLTVNSGLDADYELSELIVLAPAEAYPFDVLPQDPIRSLGLDGTTMPVPIPFTAEKVPPGPNPPLIYRVQFGTEGDDSAIYFNPRDLFRVEQLVTFRPFSEGGCMVTPAYWGSHWPLGRGKTTGWAIDERIHVSPSHNSLMSWERKRPEPISRRVGPAIDTLGHARDMQTQRWVWMIGVTGEPDDKLIARARSFFELAALEVEGAAIATEPYAIERRAYRLAVTENSVAIGITPAGHCVNPVFELLDAPKTLVRVTLGERQLREDEYAWDGQTLWLGVDIDAPVRLQLEFKE